MSEKKIKNIKKTIKFESFEIFKMIFVKNDFLTNFF